MSTYTTSRPQTSGAYYVASALYNAGFRGWPLVVMTAIAGNESSWNPFQINNDPSTGDYSVGMTQINYFDGLLDSRTAAYGSPSYLESSPSAQAAATYSLAGGNGLSGLHNWGGGQWNGQSGSSPSFSEAGYGSRFAQNLPMAATAVAQVNSQGPASNATVDNQAGWPTNGGPPVGVGGSTLSAVNSGTNAQQGGQPGNQPGTCGAKGNVFSEGGFLGIGSFAFSWCHVKALTGSALMISGGLICLVGLSLITGVSVAGSVAGRLAKAPSRAASTAEGTAGASATERASQARFRRQSDEISATNRAQAEGRATGREAGAFPYE